jgi:hypothetical protein
MVHGLEGSRCPKRSARQRKITQETDTRDRNDKRDSVDAVLQQSLKRSSDWG